MFLDEPQIIMETTWNQAQFLLDQSSEINPRSQNGRRIYRYSGIIKCAECGSSLIAKIRRQAGVEYVEYTCNSNHRHGKQFCTPHTVRESQIDELIEEEVHSLKENIILESKRYDKIIKDWIREKPLYEQRIQHHDDKILALKQEIEDLIIERINDRKHAEIYNFMISKGEDEIESLQKQISDCGEYDKICMQKREQLKTTSEVLDDILSQGEIV